jgi:ATP/maltotriose-dependent transcriptional regulator MalT
VGGFAEPGDGHVGRLLAEARAAYRQRNWPRAHQRFRAAWQAGEVEADDLYQASDAAWWMGDNAAFFEACEAAYRRYLESRRPRRAAIAALDLAVACFLRGDDTLGSGWMGRASRHLEGEPEAAEHGYLVYVLEVEGPLGGIAPSAAGAAESVLAAARRVQEIGRRHGDPTLVAAGMLGEGRALIKAGRVSDGLALLDETMVALLTDELNPAWAGNIYCNLMSAANHLADYRRARRWTEATTRWLAGMPVAVVFNGICRLHRARILQLGGEWDRAEEEAAQVGDELAEIFSTTAAAAHYRVAEIRRLRGDLAAAEQAYHRAHELGHDPQPGLALLRLAQGRWEAGAASLRAALVAEGDPLARARLRAAQVEIALAAGDLELADAASAELEEVAATWSSSGLEIGARYARGATLLGSGRHEEALPLLRDACRGWGEIEAPYDCARVRELLARAYELLGDTESALRERDAAGAAYARLGARVDARRIAASRQAGPLPGGLTCREAEVLTLVAAGGSNRSVARDLGISEKTVARHLANVFGKLGVGSRTAAAAFAFEHGLAGPTPR